jgi:hypothetical protein
MRMRGCSSGRVGIPDVDVRIMRMRGCSSGRVGIPTLTFESCGCAVEWEVPRALALTSASGKVRSDCALGNLGICAQTCRNYNIGCRLLEVANVHDIILLCGLPFCGRCSTHPSGSVGYSLHCNPRPPRPRPRPRMVRLSRLSLLPRLSMASTRGESSYKPMAMGLMLAAAVAAVQQ